MISILDILCWFDLVKDCGVLSTPTNGAQTSDGSVVGSSTSFSCDTGYKLEGASTRLCRIDGTWSRTDTSCVRKLLFYIINIFNTALARTNHGLICWTSTIISRLSLLRLSLLRLYDYCSDCHCSGYHCSDYHCSDYYCSDYHCYDSHNRRIILYLGSTVY